MAIRGDGDKETIVTFLLGNEGGNFELVLYRLTGSKANSGVSIRGQGHYQTRIFNVTMRTWAHRLGKASHGADFHAGRREHRCFRGDSLVIDKNDKPNYADREWIEGGGYQKGGRNAVNLSLGNNFKFVINGASAEFTEHCPKRTASRRMIQLQLHNPKMLAEFKDLH